MHINVQSERSVLQLQNEQRRPSYSFRPAVTDLKKNCNRTGSVERVREEIKSRLQKSQKLQLFYTKTS